MNQHIQNPELASVIRSVEPADESFAAKAASRWASIAHPLGSLGRLETDIIRICAAQRTLIPQLAYRAVAVFCADNGIVAENVSQSGQNVTGIVAENMCRGDTSVCTMARTVKAEVFPVDVGMACAVDDPRMNDMHIARGTEDFLLRDAMTRVQAESALLHGAQFAAKLAGEGYTLLAAGEMGIGNTTTSSAVASVLLDIPADKMTGKGAGLSDKGVEHKVQVIRDGIAARRPDPSDAVDVLSKVGGFDIAAMAGFYAGCAANHVPVIIDGFIAAVASLCAVYLCSSCSGYLIASHISAEPATQCVFDELNRRDKTHGIEPVICARMRCGEGTGAVAAIPLLDMAAAVFSEMSSFSDIKLEAYKPL